MKTIQNYNPNVVPVIGSTLLLTTKGEEMYIGLKAFLEETDQSLTVSCIKVSEANKDNEIVYFEQLPNVPHYLKYFIVKPLYKNNEAKETEQENFKKNKYNTNKNTSI